MTARQDKGKIAGIGQPGQDREERLASKDRTAGTGRLWHSSQERTAMREWLEQDSRDRSA
jgi:hypothetical protein